jgi:hypothetical protein
MDMFFVYGHGLDMKKDDKRLEGISPGGNEKEKEGYRLICPGFKKIIIRELFFNLRRR